MIIEFFGEPGSGKTTALKALVAASDGRIKQAKIESKTEALLYFFVFLLAHPLVSAYWLGAIVKNAHGLFRYKLSLVLTSLALVQKARQEKADVVCIDEAMLQRILTVFDASIEDSQLQRAMARVPLSDYVVVCRGASYSRFTTEPDRFNSPRLRLGEEAFDTWRKAVHENAKKVLLNPVMQNRLLEGPIRFEATNEWAKELVRTVVV